MKGRKRQASRNKSSEEKSHIAQDLEIEIVHGVVRDLPVTRAESVHDVKLGAMDFVHNQPR